MASRGGEKGRQCRRGGGEELVWAWARGEHGELTEVDGGGQDETRRPSSGSQRRHSEALGGGELGRIGAQIEG